MLIRHRSACDSERSVPPPAEPPSPPASIFASQGVAAAESALVLLLPAELLEASRDPAPSPPSPERDFNPDGQVSNSDFRRAVAVLRRF